MFELYNFTRFLSMVMFSMYVGIFYTLQTKFIMFVLYVMSHNQDFLWKILTNYYICYSDNEIFRYVIMGMYLPLYFLKVVDVLSHVVHETLKYVYAKLKKCPVFAPTLEMCENYYLTWNDRFIMKRNKVVNQMVAYVKHRVIHQIINNNNFDLRMNIRDLDIKKEKTHQMKVNISEKMKKMKEMRNKKNI